MWSALSHTNIVPLLGIYTNNGPLPIIEVPYYRNGSIREYNVGANSSTKLHQSLQIAAGLSYLHKKGFHHGNICPTNIMVKDDGGICIADPAFNMLMRQLTYDPYVPTPAAWCYKPWEELQNNVTGPEADVYSWASVVYEVFCGRPPYHGYYHSRGIVKIINRGHRTLDRPLEISPELWGILQKCWKFSPAARLTMPQVELELRQLV
ncbi:hypothetical protein PILCRDRAFT_74473 [Piloderma croceum F 1598]|uniref:Protein kinase domain-containing protein n=1 Tax=Piloderma croceum (strain F 1598) TaxID=765440 RepID=A0A0C3FHM4_PILCF|nr:hypothetical protein PILCRDRAFT_74473 [Piloderma croceum F 1598]